MIKYTRHSLKKLETLFKELDYTVRYERGNFNSGYCIVEDRNIAIINKFYDVEGRINVLLEIFHNMEAVDEKALSEPSVKLIRQIARKSEEEE